MIRESIIKIVNKEDLSYDEAKSTMLEIMRGETSATQNAAFLAALSTKSAKAETIDEISGCLEALGVNISEDPDKCRQMLDEANFCFMFAQKYHSAMKYVGPIRKELGFRTVFNILGPLTNPARPEFFLLGVYDEYLVEPIAKVLSSLGVRRALVVYGKDKLDEISASAPTTVCELKDGFYRTMQISPEDFDLPIGTKDEITGGTPEENADITRDILEGKIQGTRRNIVLLNAGAALYVGGEADSIASGVKLAADLIDSGKAAATLDNVIKASNS